MEEEDIYLNSISRPSAYLNTFNTKPLADILDMGI